MSLINQVLQDLDRRHAAATALPPAVLRVAPSAGHGRPRLVAVSIGAALLAVAITAAAALVWPQTAAPAPAQPMATDRESTQVPGGTDLGIAHVYPSTTTVPLARNASEVTVVDFAAAAAAAGQGRSAVARSGVSLPAAPVAGANRSFGEGASVASAEASGPGPAAPLQRLAIASREAALPAPVAVAVAMPVQLEKSSPALSPAERADVEYRRGIELHDHARADDAEAAFAAALQQDAGHASARRALAVEWIGRGRVQEAERMLGEGLALNAQQPQLAVVLARIQAERHDVRASIETLRSSLGNSAAAPADQAEARALMATLQQSAGQHREAVDGFAAALRQMPQNGVWWIGLGFSLAAEGRTASSREAFERARATGTLTPELLLYVEQRLAALR